MTMKIASREGTIFLEMTTQEFLTIAERYCDYSKGFEGPDTFPACEECSTCKIKHASYRVKKGLEFEQSEKCPNYSLGVFCTCHPCNTERNLDELMKIQKGEDPYA